MQGIEYLKRKLITKQSRVKERYKYYEMKKEFGTRSDLLTPKMKAQYKSVLGWCTKAVDALADRLVFRGFSEDALDVTNIFNMNNPDVFFDSAILSALISSCCFVYISPDADGFPRLQVIDGGNATGMIDDITGLLTEGYAVLERDPNTKKPTLEAYFVPGRTDYIQNGVILESTEHSVDYPLLVPIIYRPDAVRPFGHSRISRTCMYAQQLACRTLERSEISADFYSFPQKYIVGLSPEAESLDKWSAAMSALLQIEKDEDGDRPTVGQFTQQSMSPYTEQLRTVAAVFAGETGLTMDDLGFVTDNPSSSEAIRAAHETLRLTAKKAQRSFGSGFLNVGFLAACLRDNIDYQRNQLHETVPKWEPVFEPDAASLSGTGDALIKIQQAFPDYLTEEKLRDLTGF